MRSIYLCLYFCTNRWLAYIQSLRRICLLSGIHLAFIQMGEHVTPPLSDSSAFFRKYVDDIVIFRYWHRILMYKNKYLDDRNKGYLQVRDIAKA